MKSSCPIQIWARGAKPSLAPPAKRNLALAPRTPTGRTPNSNVGGPRTGRTTPTSPGPNLPTKTETNRKALHKERKEEIPEETAQSLPSAGRDQPSVPRGRAADPDPEGPNSSQCQEGPSPSLWLCCQPSPLSPPQCI